jgi:hypothetical protein
MIKRATAIVLMLLTNIVILVHAVVPHHHHQKQACHVKSHCLVEIDENGQNTNKNTRNHDGDNNSNHCVLNELLIVTSNKPKHEIKFINYTSDHPGNDDFQNSLLNNCPEAIPISTHFVSVPSINNAYSSLVSASLGLRAPPVV